MSCRNASETKSLDVLKCLPLSVTIQYIEALDGEKRILEDRQDVLQGQRNDMLSINKVFQGWLAHLQKVLVE